MTYREHAADGYFLLLASPGAAGPKPPVTPKDIVFVLDTSGSMAGNKLTQAKKALEFCVENLNAGDRFDIVRFSTEAESMFGQLAPATPAHRQRARDFIKDLKPLGGTAIDDALTQALTLNPDLVIFLTDGQPTIGHTREEDILAGVKRRNTGNARVFCFGIGTDINTHLLDKITAQTRAVSQYVLPDEDLEVKVSHFYTKIKEPALTNPTLRFTGDIQATKLYPTPLPDLFHGDQLVVVGRYAGAGPAAVILEGASHDALRRWATRRIGYLLDEIRLHGENRELKDEVTELARQFGIVTPYTAYLIVEDEDRRGVPVARRSLPAFARDRAAREQAAQTWTTFESARAGGGAVTAARATDAFKQLDNLADLGGVAARENVRAYLAGSATPAAPAVVQRFAHYTQQSRSVQGRAFYHNGAQWVDALVQQHPQAPRVAVKFGAPEYFDLLAKHRHAGAWFALGPNLQLLLGDTIYEITD